MNNIIECPTEDSVDCFWNAPTRGNGERQSFYTDAAGTQHFIEGCPQGAGLPALGQDSNGTWWAYCEPALGNNYTITDPTATETSTAVDTQGPMLPPTGDTFDPTALMVSSLLLILGAALAVLPKVFLKARKTK